MHLRLDGYGDRKCLNNAEYMRAFMVGLARIAGMTVVNGPNIHDFAQGDPSKHGLTAFTMIAESHIACHTWPERGRTSKEGWMSLDLYSCKEFDAARARDYAIHSFGLEALTLDDIDRDRGGPPVVARESGVPRSVFLGYNQPEEHNDSRMGLTPRRQACE